MMDARRKQVYTGIYRFEDHELVTVSAQKAIAVEELIQELNALGEAVTFLGDGVTVYQEMLKEKPELFKLLFDLTSMALWSESFKELLNDLFNSS